MKRQKIIEEYRKFIDTNRKYLEKDYVALTARQKKFVDLVLFLTHTELQHKHEDIAKVAGVSKRTVDRAIKVMKEMVMPYRRTDRMISRSVEIETLGKISSESARMTIRRMRDARS